jgi:hypothetical protein
MPDFPSTLSIAERQVDALERIAKALETIAAQRGRREQDQPTQRALLVEWSRGYASGVTAAQTAARRDEEHALTQREKEVS